jgi:hypothetical protein
MGLILDRHPLEPGSGQRRLSKQRKPASASPSNADTQARVGARRYGPGLDIARARDMFGYCPFLLALAELEQIVCWQTCITVVIPRDRLRKSLCEKRQTSLKVRHAVRVRPEHHRQYDSGAGSRVQEDSGAQR